MEGSGTLLLRSSELDPVESVPVLQMIRTEYQEHDIAASAEVAGTVDAESFLPFHYGRQDDFFVLHGALGTSTSI